MPMTLWIAVMIATTVVAVGSVDAQVQGTCVYNCGGGASSSTSNGPPPGHDSAELREIDRQNAARELVKDAIRDRRGKNVRALELARNGAYRQALEMLEGALRRYPDDQLIARSLEQVRARQAEVEVERAAKQAAAAAAKTVAIAQLTAPYQVVAQPLVITPIAVSKPARKIVPVPVPAIGETWDRLEATYDLRGDLEPVRKTLRETAADAVDFTRSHLKFVALQHMPFANGVVDFYDMLEETKELREKHEEVANQLVDQIASQSHEVASIMASGRGDPAHALEATQRSVALIGQFVEEQAKSQIWDRVKEWGHGMVPP